jgi:hypothetical protein
MEKQIQLTLHTWQIMPVRALHKSKEDFKSSCETMFDLEQMCDQLL